MASDPPPQRPDEELVVVDDADFGPMRLIRRWSAGKSEGEREWREFDMLSWEAKRDDVAISIDVAAPSATPGLAPNTRSIILRVISNEAETRVAVAENIIDIAREWMFMSGDGPEPTIDSFAAGIVLETASIALSMSPCGSKRLRKTPTFRSSTATASAPASTAPETSKSSTSSDIA